MQDIYKLLWFARYVTASPIMTNLAISEVDKGRTLAGNNDDAVWISKLWHPHEPVSAKVGNNPVFGGSSPSRVSLTYNRQACRFFIYGDAGAISLGGN